MQGGFPHLRALWGDAVPFPLPVDRTYFGPPRGPPWVGPIIDAVFADSIHEQNLMRQGKPLPAREYSEDTSPYASHWLLNTKLACFFGIFLLRTHLQEGFTASAAARAGAIAFYKKIEADEAVAIAATYIDTLMSDDFLAVWVARSTDNVHLWGTDDDPRNLPIQAGSMGGGGWPTGSWGAGTVWGGSWGGGWGAGTVWVPPVRKHRQFPRIYGYRRMGAVFHQPRPVNWRKLRRKPFAWLRRLEWQWCCHEGLMLSVFLAPY
ncbi:hypothetical protein B0H14DRAFT_3474732 [Mycena olivaceomarginata]|nr:hypothetical protein B0H14DRAFT_3474732 [Mycena olivaceomarginata]